MNRDQRNQLVLQHLPLVEYLVSEITAKASHLSQEDLAQVGSVALLTSADCFDPGLGVPFGAFARQRILGAFADDMRASDWATRSARKRIKDTLAAQDRLRSVLERSPTIREIAEALCVEPGVVEGALADAERRLAPMDNLIVETLAADTASPEHSVLADERTKYLRAAIAALPERMRYIVEEIYLRGRTVKELAAELGFTHAAVSQMRSEAVRLMRDGLTAHYSDEPGKIQEPHSRIHAKRRAMYLSAMGDVSTGGMAREGLS